MCPLRCLLEPDFVVECYALDGYEPAMDVIRANSRLF